MQCHHGTTTHVQQAGLLLVPSPVEHLAQLMTWFRTHRACRQWGGPRFRFPFDARSFRADARYDELPSYSLVRDSTGELLGFGQYYERGNLCHLARVAVCPLHRDRGIGAELVVRLAATGCAELETRGCSLFVLADNPAAVRLYERLGFRPAVWPPDAPPLEGGIYMVREGTPSAGALCGC
ncbi:MAG TPA: GNAT family N-acetyltransferase [Steroidobacteraceae bacterium]|nr:GNAT family N-acetyltransferase [Steroidobacteraceae bacterium]